MHKSHKIRPEVDVNMISEILMCMYGGMMEAYFTKRLNHDFDDVVKNGFNLIFNSIKTEERVKYYILGGRGAMGTQL